MYARQPSLIATHTYTRHSGIDLTKGLAVMLMILYHVIYDLAWFSYLPSSMPHQWPWSFFPHLIITLFYFCSGINSALQHQKNLSLKLKQLIMRLFIPAMGISLITFFVFPGQWIFFGTLHCLFFSHLCLIILKHFHKATVSVLLFCSAVVMMLSLIVAFLPPTSALSHPFFPPSVDFVPLLPWMMIPWLGYLFFISRSTLSPFPLCSALYSFLIAEHNSWSSSPAIIQTLLSFLAWLGRHSLMIYLSHQLILFPLVAISTLFRSHGF
jgi:uncharacterized membrane protein